jgi:hypothetical protein
MKGGSARRGETMADKNSIKAEGMDERFSFKADDRRHQNCAPFLVRKQFSGLPRVRLSPRRRGED